MMQSLIEKHTRGETRRGLWVTRTLGAKLEIWAACRAGGNGRAYLSECRAETLIEAGLAFAFLSCHNNVACIWR